MDHPDKYSYQLMIETLLLNVTWYTLNKLILLIYKMIFSKNNDILYIWVFVLKILLTRVKDKKT